MNKKNIISLSDILESRIKKTQQLEEYERRIEELKDKVWWLNKEIALNNFILDAVRNSLTPEEMVKGVLANELDKLTKNEPEKE